MKIIVGETLYETNRKGLRRILKTASRQIPFGIYAVEKDGMCELKKDKFINKEELREEVAEYAAKGFKVHYNS